MSETLNIDTRGINNEGEMKAMIYNSVGELVNEMELNANSVNVFNGENLSNGIYFIIIQTSTQQSNFKLIVDR